MSDYISRDEALDCIRGYLRTDKLVYIDPKNIIRVIKSIPAADVEPVRHAKWVVEKCEGVSTIFACSNCSHEITLRNAYFMKPTELASEWRPYCYCGARMGGSIEK